MKRLKYSLWIILFLLIAQSAFANDFLFSQATAGIVGLAFLAWLVLGSIIKLLKSDLMFIGPGGITFLIITIVHIEIAFMFWMIYLAILTVYFASPREGISPIGRKINLIFHGGFLLIVIIGGIIGKVIYYSKMSGFASWSARMRDNYKGVLIIFAIIFIIELTYLSRKGKMNKKKKGGGSDPYKNV